MGTITRKVGLLLGSARKNGNGAGLASWLAPVLQRRLNKPPYNEPSPFDIVTVDPLTSPLPLGPITDGSRFPAQIKDSEQYSTPAIREWSRLVSSLSAVVILSPEYNGSYPGELKNAFDHLYWEWNSKPVLLVTYGSQGGGRVAKQLSELISNFKVRTTSSPVQIKLPPEYVAGNERVQPGKDAEFLSAYEAAVEKAAGELAQLASEKA